MFTFSPPPGSYIFLTKHSWGSHLLMHLNTWIHCICLCKPFWKRWPTSTKGVFCKTILLSLLSTSVKGSLMKTQKERERAEGLLGHRSHAPLTLKSCYQLFAGFMRLHEQYSSLLLLGLHGRVLQINWFLTCSFLTKCWLFSFWSLVGGHQGKGRGRKPLVGHIYRNVPCQGENPDFNVQSQCLL